MGYIACWSRTLLPNGKLGKPRVTADEVVEPEWFAGKFVTPAGAENMRRRPEHRLQIVRETEVYATRAMAIAKFKDAAK